MRNLFLLISSWVICFSSLTTYASGLAECKNQNCVAVVDAGSTGSRLHIYTVDHRAGKNNINVKELWVNKIEPGFTSVAASKESIRSYLNKLFNVTPESKLPVYFYATAGMRLLPDHKQAEYFDYLKQWFSATSAWNLVDARTITGTEEGLFAWLGVNYQLGNFNEKDSPSVGVMDMGGASVQVAFPVKDLDFMQGGDLVATEVNGKKYKLFVHSFLGLGKSVLSYQFLDETSCYSEQYKLPNGLVGDGDAEACQTDVTKLINVVHDVNTRVQPILLQNRPTTWYALGNLQYMVEEPPFQIKDRQFTSQELLAQGSSKVCTQPWPELVKNYPDNPSIYSYCLLPSYYYALMVNGYGISPEKTIHLLSDSSAADWTIGVPLHIM